MIAWNLEKFKESEMRGQRVKIEGWIERMDKYRRSYDGEAEWTDANALEFIADWFSDETKSSWLTPLLLGPGAPTTWLHSRTYTGRTGLLGSTADS